MANELVTKSYDIDISKTGARPIVRLSQYDTRTVRVLFTVYDGTELQVIDGCTARVDGKRSDGTAFTKPCDIEAGSKVAFTVEAEMTNSAGKHDAELVIINSDGNPLGTQNFTIDVEKAPFERESAATVEDRTLYDQYTTAVDTRVTAAIKKADDAVTADTGKVDKLVSDTQARIDAIVSEAVTPIERGGTGATTADKACTALGLDAFNLVDEDLDYTTGFKRTRSFYAASGNTVAHKPDGVDAFSLTVLRAAEGSYVQILASSTDIYYRCSKADGWTQWKKMLNDYDIHDTGWVSVQEGPQDGDVYYRRVGCVVTVEITYTYNGVAVQYIGKIPESIVPNTERSVDFVISKYTGDDSKRYAALARVGADGRISILGNMTSGESVSGAFTYVIGF